MHSSFVTDCERAFALTLNGLFQNARHEASKMEV
jgi:hypothetical protein